MSTKKSYAVFGLGRYGIAVAKELVKSGAEVLAVDISQEVVNNAISENNTYHLNNFSFID